MDKTFFEDLDLPKPKYNLNVRESLHGKMVGLMLEAIEAILIKEQPRLVVVQGDTNTTLAGALAAAKLQIKVAHVEAGLRSYDRTMPEEINRIMVDHLSDLLFCPTHKQKHILTKEGINRNQIFVTGNTIVDAVNQNLTVAQGKKEYQHFSHENFMLLTLHRPANVDNPKLLENLLKILTELALKLKLKIYFPAHPRTLQELNKHNFKVDPNTIELLEPVNYHEMLILEKYARLILTDSGGIQEEACIIHVPCVTLRDNTERPETVDVGANLIAGTKREAIFAAAQKMLSGQRNWENPYGHGKAAKKIVENLD